MVDDMAADVADDVGETGSSRSARGPLAFEKSARFAPGVSGSIGSPPEFSGRSDGTLS
jgi:hypothetical protein